MSWVQAIIEAFKNPPDGLEFCRALNISDNTYNLTRVKFTYDTTNPEPTKHSINFGIWQFMQESGQIGHLTKEL